MFAHKGLFPLLILSLLINIPSAIASMRIDRAIVVFSPDKPPRTDLEIFNTSNETLYVKVEVFEVDAPGTESQKKIPITNPEDIELLVNPNKMIIPANGHKLLRMVNLSPPTDAEKIYRVNVTPVVGEIESTQTAIKIVIAYSILVIVQPIDPKPDLHFSNNGKTVSITNKGNTNVLFRDGKQCPPNDSTDQECVDLPTKRIYAGNTWSFEKSLDTEINYVLTIGEKHKTMSFLPH